MKALLSVSLALAVFTPCVLAAAPPDPPKDCKDVLDAKWGDREEREAKRTNLKKDSDSITKCANALAQRARDTKASVEKIQSASRAAEGSHTPKPTPTPTPSPAPTPTPTPEPMENMETLREEARALHRQYKSLKKVRRDMKWSQTSEEAELRDAAHDAMATAGLRGEDISARFVSGFALTDVGGAGGGDPEDKTIPQGHIVWSTRHWGNDRVDGNLGGRLGFQPALSLFAPEEQADAPEGTDTVADYQEAFVWDVGGGGNLHLGPFQLSAQGRAGQVRLGSDSVLVKTDPAMIVVPLQNGEAKWFWEAGVKACLYRQTVDVLHEQNGLTAPSLEVSAGFRRDLRFDNDAAKVIFNDPADRRYFRFALNGISVRDFPGDSKETAQPKMFTLSFAVEHEWGREGGVPAATRFLINGNVDLLRALRGDRP